MSNYYGSSNYYGNNPDPTQSQQQPQQSYNYQPGYGAGGGGGGYNVQQWQQSAAADGNAQQQQQQQQQQFQYQTHPGAYSGAMAQQQTQQPQQPSLSFWNPAAVATVASLASGATAGTGGQQDAMLLDLAGKTLMHSSGSAAKYLIPGFATTMSMLRPYFAVDNRFILKKIQRLLMPYVFHNWSRQRLDSGHGGYDPHQYQNSNSPTPPTPSYALPHSDENAPDLYLPSMSLISYVLLCALCYGTAGKFNPEVLPDVTTKCFIIQLVEVLLIRCGFYMMQVPVAFLDLLCYTGYKYLGLCVTLSSALMVKLLIPSNSGTISKTVKDMNSDGSSSSSKDIKNGNASVYLYYIAFLWTASAASYVMLKTMSNNIPSVTAATGPKREVMVLAFCLLQFVAMWFVSQTKFL